MTKKKTFTTKKTTTPKTLRRPRKTVYSKLTIYKSSKYDLFYSPPTQRKVTMGSVRRLERSIVLNGYFESKPILCTETEVEGVIRLEILDGQHRFQALKNLNMPIIYTVNNNLSNQEVPSMQEGQGSWSPMDHVRSYAAMGNPAYIQMVSLMSEYGLTLNDVAGFPIAIQNGFRANGGDYRTALKRAELEIKDLDQVYQWCYFLKQWKTVRKSSGYSNVGGNPIKKALLELFLHPKFTVAMQGQLLSQYGKYHNKIVPNYSSSLHSNALQDLVAVYNYGYGIKSRWGVTNDGKKTSLIPPKTAPNKKPVKKD